MITADEAARLFTLTPEAVEPEPAWKGEADLMKLASDESCEDEKPKKKSKIPPQFMSKLDKKKAMPAQNEEEEEGVEKEEKTASLLEKLAKRRDESMGEPMSRGEMAGAIAGGAGATGAALKAIGPRRGLLRAMAIPVAATGGVMAGMKGGKMIEDRLKKKKKKK